MKKVIIASLLILVAIPAYAQTKPNLVFGGVRYSTTVGDGEKKMMLSFGYGCQLTGNLWTVSSGEVGTSGYVALDPSLCYMFKVTETPTILLTMGLVAGPGVDWVTFGDSTSYAAYIPGAIGAVAYLENIKNGFGGFISVREKFAVTNGTRYANGLTATIGLSKRF